VKKSRGLFLFKRNENKNCKGNLTPVMPFAARFSCCGTIDFISILIYFPRGLWQQILYQNLWNSSNYWPVKKSRRLFLLERNEKKNCKGPLTPVMPFAARFSCCATIAFNSILKYFPRGLWSVVCLMGGERGTCLGPPFFGAPPWGVMRVNFPYIWWKTYYPLI